MSTQPDVSVIVPVYNGEAYLQRCLDSLISQTLEGLEIVVVDDASTDATASLLEGYAHTATRPVRVITQPRNQGVSAARNTGIEAARGRFIAFVDADDFVDPTMYQRLHDIGHRMQVDVVSCGITVVDAKGCPVKRIDYPAPSGVRLDARQLREVMGSGFTSKLYWYPFRSIYRRDLVEDPAIRFDVHIRKGEDSLFNLEVLSRARSCAVTDEAFYNYRQHAGSVTARPLPSESRNLDALGDRVMQFLGQQGYAQSAADDFYRYILRSDLPTAIVRLAAAPGDSSGELRSLKSSPHARTALEYMGSLRGDAPWRVVFLLLFFKYLPVSVLSTGVGLAKRLVAIQPRR